MTNEEFVLSIMAKLGKIAAQSLQDRISTMSSTEIVNESDLLPEFNPEKQYLNFQAGYVCRSPIGNAVKLLQPYDSTIYTQPPEELPAQWGFYWSSDPTKAKSFLKLATSPYNVNDCCEFEGYVYRSTIPNNVWSPDENPSGWVNLGEVTEVMESSK